MRQVADQELSPDLKWQVLALKPAAATAEKQVPVGELASVVAAHPSERGALLALIFQLFGPNISTRVEQVAKTKSKPSPKVRAKAVPKTRAELLKIAATKNQEQSQTDTGRDAWDQATGWGRADSMAFVTNVEAFQRLHGLSVTGVFDHPTQAAFIESRVADKEHQRAQRIAREDLELRKLIRRRRDEVEDAAFQHSKTTVSITPGWALALENGNVGEANVRATAATPHQYRYMVLVSSWLRNHPDAVELFNGYKPVPEETVDRIVSNAYDAEEDVLEKVPVRDVGPRGHAYELNRVLGFWLPSAKEGATLRFSAPGTYVVVAALESERTTPVGIETFQVRPNELTEFEKGVVRGTYNVQMMFAAGAAAMAKGVGAHKLSDHLLKDIAGTLERQAAKYQSNVPDFDHAMQGIGPFLAYAAGGIGEQVPTLITMVIGGGVGAAVAQKVATKVATDLTKKYARDYSERAAAEYVVKQSAQWRLRGSFGGAFAVNAEQQAGEIYSDLVEVQEKYGLDQKEGAVFLALAGGIVGGYLETLVPFAMARAWGLGGKLKLKLDLATQIAKDSALAAKVIRIGRSTPGTVARTGAKVVGTVGGGAAGEGITELAQSEIGILAQAVYDRQFDWLGAENMAKRKEAFAKAFIVGGAMGVGGAGGHVNSALRAKQRRDLEARLEAASESEIRQLAEGLAQRRPAFPTEKGRAYDTFLSIRNRQPRVLLDLADAIERSGGQNATEDAFLLREIDLRWEIRLLKEKGTPAGGSPDNDETRRSSGDASSRIRPDTPILDEILGAHEAKTKAEQAQRAAEEKAQKKKRQEEAEERARNRALVDEILSNTPATVDTSPRSASPSPKGRLSDSVPQHLDLRNQIIYQTEYQDRDGVLQARLSDPNATPLDVHLARLSLKELDQKYAPPPPPAGQLLQEMLAATTVSLTTDEPTKKQTRSEDVFYLPTEKKQTGPITVDQLVNQPFVRKGEEVAFWSGGKIEWGKWLGRPPIEEDGMEFREVEVSGKVRKVLPNYFVAHDSKEWKAAKHALDTEREAKADAQRWTQALVNKVLEPAPHLTGDNMDSIRFRALEEVDQSATEYTPGILRYLAELKPLREKYSHTGDLYTKRLVALYDAVESAPARNRQRKESRFTSVDQDRSSGSNNDSQRHGNAGGRTWVEAVPPAQGPWVPGEAPRFSRLARSLQEKYGIVTTHPFPGGPSDNTLRHRDGAMTVRSDLIDNDDISPSVRHEVHHAYTLRRKGFDGQTTLFGGRAGIIPSADDEPIGPTRKDLPISSVTQQQWAALNNQWGTGEATWGYNNFLGLNEVSTYARQPRAELSTFLSDVTNGDMGGARTKLARLQKLVTFSQVITQQTTQVILRAIKQLETNGLGAVQIETQTQSSVENGRRVDIDVVVGVQEIPSGIGPTGLAEAPFVLEIPMYGTPANKGVDSYLLYLQSIYETCQALQQDYSLVQEAIGKVWLSAEQSNWNLTIADIDNVTLDDEPGSKNNLRNLTGRLVNRVRDASTIPVDEAPMNKRVNPEPLRGLHVNPLSPPSTNDGATADHSPINKAIDPDDVPRGKKPKPKPVQGKASKLDVEASARAASKPAETSPTSSAPGKAAAAQPPLSAQVVSGQAAHVEWVMREINETAEGGPPIQHPQLVKKAVQELVAMDIGAFGETRSEQVPPLRPTRHLDGFAASSVQPPDKSSDVLKISNAQETLFFKKTGAEAEIAASLIDQRMGLGLVPKTVAAQLGNSVGSAQQAVGEGFVTPNQAKPNREVWSNAKAFDYLMGQEDRIGKNYFVHKDSGAVQLIDNGSSLSPYALPPSPRTGMLPDSYSPDFLRGFSAVTEAWVRETIGPLLSPLQLDGLLLRRRVIELDIANKQRSQGTTKEQRPHAPLEGEKPKWRPVGKDGAVPSFKMRSGTEVAALRGETTVVFKDGSQFPADALLVTTSRKGWEDESLKLLSLDIAKGRGRFQVIEANGKGRVVQLDLALVDFIPTPGGDGGSHDTPRADGHTDGVPPRARSGLHVSAFERGKQELVLAGGGRIPVGQVKIISAKAGSTDRYQVESISGGKGTFVDQHGATHTLLLSDVVFVRGEEAATEPSDNPLSRQIVGSEGGQLIFGDGATASADNVVFVDPKATPPYRGRGRRDGSPGVGDGTTYSGPIQGGDSASATIQPGANPDTRRPIRDLEVVANPEGGWRPSHRIQSVTLPSEQEILAGGESAVRAAQTVLANLKQLRLDVLSLAKQAGLHPEALKANIKPLKDKVREQSLTFQKIAQASRARVPGLMHIYSNIQFIEDEVAVVAAPLSQGRLPNDSEWKKFGIKYRDPAESDADGLETGALGTMADETGSAIDDTLTIARYERQYVEDDEQEQQRKWDEVVLTPSATQVPAHLRELTAQERTPSTSDDRPLVDEQPQSGTPRAKDPALHDVRPTPIDWTLQYKPLPVAFPMSQRNGETQKPALVDGFLAPIEKNLQQLLNSGVDLHVAKIRGFDKGKAKAGADEIWAAAQEQLSTYDLWRPSHTFEEKGLQDNIFSLSQRIKTVINDITGTEPMSARNKRPVHSGTEIVSYDAPTDTITFTDGTSVAARHLGVYHGDNMYTLVSVDLSKGAAEGRGEFEELDAKPEIGSQRHRVGLKLSEVLFVLPIAGGSESAGADGKAAPDAWFVDERGVNVPVWGGAAAQGFRDGNGNVVDTAGGRVTTALGGQRSFDDLRNAPVPSYTTATLPKEVAWYEDPLARMKDLEGAVKYIEAYASADHLPANYQKIYLQYLKHRWDRPIEAMDARDQRIDASDQMELLQWIRDDAQAGLDKGYYVDSNLSASRQYVEKLLTEVSRMIASRKFTLPEFDNAIALYMASLPDGSSRRYNGTDYSPGEPRSVMGTGELRDQRPPRNYVRGHYGIDAYNDGAPLYAVHDGLMAEEKTSAHNRSWSRWEFTAEHDAAHALNESPYYSQFGGFIGKGQSFGSEAVTIARQIHFKEALYSRFGVVRGPLGTDTQSFIKALYFALVHEVNAARLPEYLLTAIGVRSPSVKQRLKETLVENGVTYDAQAADDAIAAFSAFTKEYLESLPEQQGQQRIKDAKFTYQLEDELEFGSSDRVKELVVWIQRLTGSRYLTVRDAQLVLNDESFKRVLLADPDWLASPNVSESTRRSYRESCRAAYDWLLRFVDRFAQTNGIEGPHPSEAQIQPARHKPAADLKDDKVQKAGGGDGSRLPLAKPAPPTGSVTPEGGAMSTARSLLGLAPRVRLPSGRVVRVGPEFERRQHIAQEKKQRVRTDEEKGKYSLSEGTYEAFNFNRWVKNRTDNNVEKLLERHVRLLLKRPPTERPLMIVDFGGGRGISFSRLALLFEQEVKEERIAFIVTNLERNPMSSQTAISNRDHNNDETVRQSRGLIHFLEADAAELSQAEIRLPSGKTVKVLGHVDILHESFAMVHGYQNDVDWPMLGESLSDGGTIYSGSKGGLENKHDGLFDDRARANDIGVSTLGEMGIERLRRGDRGSNQYDVFTRSPEIGAFLSPELADSPDEN